MEQSVVAFCSCGIVMCLFIGCLTGPCAILFVSFPCRRVALHKYDPPDLVNTSWSSSSGSDTQSKTPKSANSVATVAPTPVGTTPVKPNKCTNLNLVVVGSLDANSEVPLEETTPVSLASPDGLLDNSGSGSSSPLFAASSRNALDFEDGDDSDDDIL